MKISIICTLLLLLSSCHVYKPILTIEEKQKIDSLKVISVIPQDEIDIQIHTIQNITGGLAFDLIDSAVNNKRIKKSERLANSLRNALIEVDINHLLNSSYKNNLTKVDWLSTYNYETRSTLTNKERNKIIRHMEQDALLVITSSYSFTPGIEALEIDSLLTFYTNRKNITEKKDMVEKKNLTHIKIGSGILRFQSDLIPSDVRELDKKLNRIHMELQKKTNGGGVKEKDKIWHRDAIKTARKESANYYIEEQKTVLDEKLAQLKSEYEIKLSNVSEKSEKIELTKTYKNTQKTIKKEAKKHKKNILLSKRSEQWLANDAKKLLTELEIGTYEIGYLLSKSLNDNTDIKTLKKNSSKVWVSKISQQPYTVPAYINGYIIRNSEDNSRHYYLLDRPSIKNDYGDYYSILKGQRILPKKVQ